MIKKSKALFKRIKKNKKVKKIILSVLVLLIVSLCSFIIGKKVGMNTDSSTTNIQIEDVIVSKETIKKTLTLTGEVTTSNTKELSLNTSYSFSKMYVEEDDIVSKGDKILKYTNGKTLKAPFDCVITNINVPDSGDKVTSGNYIEVKNIKDLIINLSVSESEIANIEIGTEVDITLTSDSSLKYTGTVSKISSVGTYSSSGSTFSVEVSLENDGKINLGMSVSCSINIQELKDVIAVPVEAVQINGDKRYVLVVDGDDTKEVEVTTGLSDDENVEIKSGLKGGEMVRVTTTTKQNTIRSNSSSGFGGAGGEMNEEGFNPGNMNGGERPGMPNGGNMPSGQTQGNRG